MVLSEQTAANPLTADFDGDGISNIDELNRMIDPLANRDDDNDGHPDDWERFYFEDTTTTNDAFADQDTDGLSDYEEAMQGTDPELDDTDGDGVLDGDDGWPRHAWITAAPLPEVRYALVSPRSLGLPTDVGPTRLDDDLTITGYRMLQNWPYDIPVASRFPYSDVVELWRGAYAMSTPSGTSAWASYSSALNNVPNRIRANRKSSAGRLLLTLVLPVFVWVRAEKRLREEDL